MRHHQPSRQARGTLGRGGGLIQNQDLPAAPGQCRRNTGTGQTGTHHHAASDRHRRNHGVNAAVFELPGRLKLDADHFSTLSRQGGWQHKAALLQNWTQQPARVAAQGQT